MTTIDRKNVHCGELSHDDKVKLLRHWKQELVQLQKGGEQNMLDERGPATSGRDWRRSRSP